MSDQEKKEQEILNQEMSKDEMETVAGGFCFMWLGRKGGCDTDSSKKYGREICKPDGTVNCSATVEEGSWCGSNDACYEDETVYFNMQDCEKAWK